jgi:hypothetical protein
MEDRLWLVLYQLIKEHLRRRRGKRQQYNDADLALLYFWSVLKERPVSWACDKRHVPPVWSGPLPSESAMSRRMRTASLRRFCRDLERLFLELLSGAATLIAWHILDAKPLVVGCHSKDKQARKGQAGCLQARGYKFHAVADFAGLVRRWAILPMNVAESVVAQGLVARLPKPGYVLMDAGGDSVALYGACADAGQRLIAPRRKPGTGLGHHAQHDDRLRAIAELEVPRSVETFGRAVYRQRTRIERLFGGWTNAPGGLTALPNWVRTRRRVRRWVQAKLILLYTRLFQNQELE